MNNVVIRNKTILLIKKDKCLVTLLNKTKKNETNASLKLLNKSQKNGSVQCMVMNHDIEQIWTKDYFHWKQWLIKKWILVWNFVRGRAKSCDGLFMISSKTYKWKFDRSLILSVLKWTKPRIWHDWKWAGPKKNQLNRQINMRKKI